MVAVGEKVPEIVSVSSCNDEFSYFSGAYHNIARWRIKPHKRRKQSSFVTTFVHGLSPDSHRPVSCAAHRQIQDLNDN